MKILNKKDIKELLSKIEKQWKAKVDLDPYGVLKNQKNKIYIINKEIAHIPTEKLRINSTGLYFGEETKYGLRLSIEGSQIVGPKATHNVVELTEEQAPQWMMGVDPEIQNKGEGFVIVKAKDDFLGCGLARKDKVLNYVGKDRRINASHASVTRSTLRE